ncbi:MAG: 2-hydroxyacid dehydrogenase [Alphaproteobacteria bacterium]
MPIDVLVNLDMPEYSRSHLAETYTLHYWPDPAEHQQLADGPAGQRIRAVQTNGSHGIKRPLIERLPALELICAVGAGYEGIDLDAARERGIVVTHNPGSNAATVADQAWALIIGSMRRVSWCDQAVRAGRWEEARQAMPAVSGKKLGVFGLGHVGSEIAKRGALGFGMEVGYHNRKPRADVDYRYLPTLVELAEWCDVLAIAAPGGPATRHAVGRDVLAVLGPEGYVVNVARGSLLSSEALIEALNEGRIAGAGLDVIDGEPAVPEGFLRQDRLVLSPHVGGFSPDAIKAMIHRVRDNFDAHFAGRPLHSPVLT